MNKKEHLLAETLGDGGGAEFARLAAARIRRRRAVRQASLATLAAVLIVVGFFARQSRQAPAATAAPPLVMTPARAAAAPAVEIISDQELLAQLKDERVLVLKGDTGITRVVFLSDQPSARPL